MLKLSNFNHWKTTLIGLLLMGVGCWLIVKEVYQLELLTLFFAAGILFIVMPDDAAAILKDFITKKIDNKTP